jgi:hypothetical protein
MRKDHSPITLTVEVGINEPTVLGFERDVLYLYLGLVG